MIDNREHQTLSCLLRNSERAGARRSAAGALDVLQELELLRMGFGAEALLAIVPAEEQEEYAMCGGAAHR